MSLKFLLAQWINFSILFIELQKILKIVYPRTWSTKNLLVNLCRTSLWYSLTSCPKQKFKHYLLVFEMISWTKKSAQKAWFKNLVYEKIFAYRVIQHG